MAYRFLDHTAELELAIEAESREEVFAQAAAALAELLDGPETGEAVSREVVSTASDGPTLLAQWLEDLVFLAETEDFVPERVEELELGSTRLRALVDGRIGRPRHLVKAITYNGLVLEPAGAGWRARAVLDV